MTGLPAIRPAGSDAAMLRPFQSSAGHHFALRFPEPLAAGKPSQAAAEAAAEGSRPSSRAVAAPPPDPFCSHLARCRSGAPL